MAAGVPRALDELVVRLLQKHPDARVQTAREAERRLRAMLQS
jgi:hypothetical protein